MAITGNIVILDEIKEEYLQKMVEWRNNPEVAKYMFDRGTFTLDNQKRWFGKIVNDATRKQFIILDKKSGAPVGAINLMDIDYSHSRADWGYYIGEVSYRMKGHAVEAEYLLLQYAFESLGLNKVYCQTLSNNMKVVSNHKKFGFQIDGILRKHHFDGSEYLDVYVMSIFKEEFAERKPALEKLLSIFSR